MNEDNSKAANPLILFLNNPHKAVYESLIDYGNGVIKEGSHYFKSLSRTIMQYLEHPEHKFNGKVGIFERKLIDLKLHRYLVKDVVLHEIWLTTKKGLIRHLLDHVLEL